MAFDKEIEKQYSAQVASKAEAKRKEYEQVLIQEELLWLQKSKINWINFGDRNTQLFHTSTLSRRNRNRVKAIKAENGEWVSSQNEILQLAVEFFNLYKENNTCVNK